MRRRDFLGVIAGSSAAWPLAARAQQPARLRRIGLVTGMQETDPQGRLNLSALQKGLRERGLNDGQNLQLDIRFGMNDAEKIRAAVTSILANSPEVIVAHGTSIAGALRQQTQTVPVVFTVVSDPVGSGFVQSFSRPGGNLTGFTNFLEPSLAAKWVELLKEIAPGVSRVGILYNPQLAAGGGLYFAQPVEASAVALGVKPIRLPVQTSADVEQVIDKFAQEPGGGLISPPDSTILAHRDLILELTARHMVPAVYPYRFFLTSGGLMSYGMDYADVFRRAAEYVDRILKGENPAELPVQAPTKFELVINLKTVKALGLTVPPTLLARADEVIDN